MSVLTLTNTRLISITIMSRIDEQDFLVVNILSSLEWEPLEGKYFTRWGENDYSDQRMRQQINERRVR